MGKTEECINIMKEQGGRDMIGKKMTEKRRNMEDRYELEKEI